MRKRRVGVTARSRLVVGNQETGTPQIATEIAAPLVSRTPMSTVAAATTECGWKRGDTTGVKAIGQEHFRGEDEMEKQRQTKNARGQRADARMRRSLILGQGDEPPETPGPLSLGCEYTEGRRTVKGPLGRQPLPPLTVLLPSEEKTFRYEGKGAKGSGVILPPVSRPRGDTKLGGPIA